MPNKFSYYGSRQSFFDNVVVTTDKNLKIGIINWWWLTSNEADISKIEKFVDSNDLCFFVSEEILDRHNNVDLNELFSVLNQKNVFYIFSAEHYSLSVPPSLNRSFYFPWFFKSPLYDEENFRTDYEYIDKPFDFNLLLGSRKANRSLTFKILNSDPKIYSTYFGHPFLKDLSNTEFEEAESLNLLTNQNVNEDKLNTMVFLNKNNSNFCLSHVVPRTIYNNSHFDIVHETFVKENHHFLTEKTAKPLATGRFFCWYASPYLKVYLGKYGFSFDTYYSNYDNSIDHLYRLDELLDLVKEISNNQNLVKHIYKITRDEREHNKVNYKNQTSTFYNNLTQWVEEVLSNA